MALRIGPKAFEVGGRGQLLSLLAFDIIFGIFLLVVVGAENLLLLFLFLLLVPSVRSAREGKSRTNILSATSKVKQGIRRRIKIRTREKVCRWVLFFDFVAFELGTARRGATVLSLAELLSI